MLTYTFDPNSKTPLYEALYRAVKTDILKGALTAHDRLPGIWASAPLPWKTPTHS